MGQCYHCGAIHIDADKRASLCYVCASEARDAYEARSPNAARLSPAPPAPFASWEEAAKHWERIAFDRLVSANKNLNRARKGEYERDEASARLVQIIRLVRRIVTSNDSQTTEQKPNNRRNDENHDGQWLSRDDLEGLRFWYSGRRS
jgi:hypothetical protein